MMADDPKIPQLKGRTAQRIRDAGPRPGAHQPQQWSQNPAPLTIQKPSERAALLSAALLLETVRQGGGTRHSPEALREAIGALRRGFNERELMEIEVEVYEILRWLGHAIDPTWPTQDPVVERINPDSSHVEVIRWAIQHGQDLFLDYYHPGRGEVTKRQVTPIKLEAETYLQGFCHLRADERIFRLSRIGELRPASGWPTKHHGPAEPPWSHDQPHHAPRHRQKTPPGQMSFAALDLDLDPQDHDEEE